MLLFLMGLSRVNLLTPSLQTIFYQWVRRDSILRFRNLTKVGESQCSSTNRTKRCPSPHRTDRMPSHYSNYRRVETLALLFALLTYKFNFFIVCSSPTYVGGENPPHPLRRGYKAGESQWTSTKRTKRCPSPHRTDRRPSHYSKNRRVETPSNL